MTALPAASSFTGSAITEAQFKSAITDQRDFLAGLLGTSGAQSAALAALGSLIGATTAKTAAYTVLAADRGRLIDCTAGTWTLTLPAAATLGDGFAFAVRNSGTGIVTIDPNSTEMIDGVTTAALAAGDSCLCVCDGSGWKTIGRSRYRLKAELITSGSGTWVCPEGVSSVFALLWGGGGGGAEKGVLSTNGGGIGGHSAGFYAVTPGHGYSYTVGAGGVGSNTANGSAGGTTSFDAFCSATGGAGGTISNNGSNGTGVGGTLRNATAASSTLISAIATSGAPTTAAVAADIGSPYFAGGGGLGKTGASNNDAQGGRGGAILLIYVGQ